MAGYDKEDYFSAPNAETTCAGKYGTLAPKKKPLISKSQQQGAGVNQQSTTAVETLRPKLQRTPHQQLPPRRPACTSG
ncbi:hypothetical protein D0Y65_023111 [Glycine soja]|uniref:Uncharacterized protein n=1 Tax=Glycine soja TaxID=3848 RepID=A0A445IWP6_GLYSO|nr:hypothetical protein D0Y65_023111 [Glycine soja]